MPEQRTEPRPPSPDDGGYAFPFDPRLPAFRSPALWCPELLPDGVVVVPAPSAFPFAQTIDLAALALVVANQRDEDGRYVILGDPEGYHRLWLTDTDPGGGLAILIPLDEDFRQRVAGALRFHRHLHGERSGPIPPRVDLTAMQRERLILMLRAFDGHEAGASYREIAAILFDPEVIHIPARDWKSSALHARVFRLVKDATALVEGGYRRMLRGG